MLTMNGMTNAWRATALMLGMTLGSAAGGCELDRRGRVIPSDGGGGEGGTLVMDGGGGEGGTIADGGMGGEGGVGGEGGMGPDPTWSPSLLRPAMGATLPPTRAFSLWQDGVIPAGRTVVGYEMCWTTGAAETIDEEGECPTMVPVSDPYHVLDPLTPGTTYRRKVRAVYDDASVSLYSGVWTFSTDNSVLSWWRLDEGTGTTAADSSGGNTGSLQGSPAWVAGINGQALQFNGMNHVMIGDVAALEGLSQLTLEAWLRTSSTATNRAFVAKWWAEASYALRMSSVTPGHVDLTIHAANGEIVTPGTTAANDGSWHHVVATYDGAWQRLFMDLVMEGETAQTGTIVNIDDELCLGDFCDGGVGQDSGFVGLLDGVVIYNRALSLEERLNGYCATWALSGASPLPVPCR